MKKVGINGFGRIGKAVLKASLLQETGIEVVAINSTSGPEGHAHLFKYDSLYGIYPEEVVPGPGQLQVGDRVISFTSCRHPAEIPWGELGVDLVIEASGLFLTKETASGHLAKGAKKVILTAPAADPDIATLVMGVNHRTYDPDRHHILSNASCTTNCLAPVAKVLEETFGIESGLMTTIHAYTADQRILDLPHQDPRRARAAAESIVPTSTGAAKALYQVLPSLKGKMNGLAVRVPVPVVSLVDLVVQLRKKAGVQQVNEALQQAAEGDMKGILGFSTLPLVSADYKKDARSAIVDGLSTLETGNGLVKVVAWYDNEWGYSNRVWDLANYIARD